MACFDYEELQAQLVKQTMDAFGRIDVLVANAGILRDKSFSKMELKDFDAVMAVHLMGTVKPCKALWEIFKKQQYGRIVVTTSSTGLYGNFGQTNYGAAKLSLVGFMNSLKLEGAKDNNANAPTIGAGVDHRDHCRRRRGGGRDRACHPLERRPAFRAALPQAANRRAWL